VGIPPSAFRAHPLMLASQPVRHRPICASSGTFAAGEVALAVALGTGAVAVATVVDEGWATPGSTGGSGCGTGAESGAGAKGRGGGWLAESSDLLWQATDHVAAARTVIRMWVGRQSERLAIQRKYAVMPRESTDRRDCLP
jgi:hypothetical protein